MPNRLLVLDRAADSGRNYRIRANLLSRHSAEPEWLRSSCNARSEPTICRPSYSTTTDGIVPGLRQSFSSHRPVSATPEGFVRVQDRPPLRAGAGGLGRRIFSLDSAYRPIAHSSEFNTRSIRSRRFLISSYSKGTFHKLSLKHLDRYIQEFSGKHNRRPLDTIDQMRAAH